MGCAGVYVSSVPVFLGVSCAVGGWVGVVGEVVLFDGVVACGSVVVVFDAGVSGAVVVFVVVIVSVLFPLGPMGLARG